MSAEYITDSCGRTDVQPRRLQKVPGDIGREEGRAGFLGGWASAQIDGIDPLEERYLSDVDPRLGSLIARVIEVQGPRRYRTSNASSHFDALARSIIYQQLSKKAAATIYERYRGVVRTGNPDEVLAADDVMLKSTGLSSPKVRYLKALATAVSSGTLDLQRIEEASDDEIIDSLTVVPGIGVWTAQMFLMFRLRRPDVLPTHDVGIQRGLQIAHGLKKPAAPGYILRAGARWAPYRSLACLYLWAGVDLRIEASAARERLVRRTRG